MAVQDVRQTSRSENEGGQSLKNKFFKQHLCSGG